MNDLKIAFWDWNGTLWDDTNQWYLAAKAAYAHANITEEITLNRLQDAFDVPVQEVIHTLGAPRDLPKENHDRLLKTFVRVLEENENLASVREHASEALSFFANQGTENFLVSNHPVPLLRKELDKGNLTDFFETICGNDNHDQVYTKGTKSERVGQHLQATGIDPRQACIIADTREEIRIARQFGMVSIAITGGYNSLKVLREEKPDHLIKHLSEIPALFQTVKPT